MDHHAGTTTQERTTAADDEEAGVRPRPVVVVAEPLAEIGLAVLRSNGLEVRDAAGCPNEELGSLVAGAHALIVRSKTKVTDAMLVGAPFLRVIGRAGVGVDTIDVEAATKAGIVVVNTPDSSTVATAEHAVTLMLASFRELGAAQRRMAEAQWSARGLVGQELSGKTLGVIGLGRIGAAVAARARGFGMTVLAHDAVLSEARAESLGVRLVSLEELLRRCDVVTLHTPLTAQTRHLIGALELAMMKPGARIVNCARGGLIDESALLRALDSGALAGAALDVVEDEPPLPGAAAWRLLHHPRVVATPHLGGSTKEAQERIAADLCRDVVAVLRGRPPRGAVNAPVTAPPEVQSFVELAHRLGAALLQIAPEEHLSHVDLALEGDLAAYDGVPFAVAFLVGVLPQLTDRRVSAVNALEIARSMGITIETMGAECERGFAKALAVRAGHCAIAGTVVHGEQLRFVAIDGFEIDVAPQGHLLMTRHRDVPGIVGKAGTILGDAGINISAMQVARAETQTTAGTAVQARSRSAVMLLGIDRAPDAQILQRLRAIHDVEAVRTIEL